MVCILQHSSLELKHNFFVVPGSPLHPPGPPPPVMVSVVGSAGVGRCSVAGVGSAGVGRSIVAGVGSAGIGHSIDVMIDMLMLLDHHSKSK